MEIIERDIIHIKSITENEKYEVRREGTFYVFEYDFDGAGEQWRVEESDSENSWFEVHADRPEAEYGEIEAAVRSFFKLDAFSVYKSDINGRPDFTIYAGSYLEAYEMALKRLGYNNLVRGGYKGNVEFEYVK